MPAFPVNCPDSLEYIEKRGNEIRKEKESKP
jgi:hypothetical protein